MNKNIFLDCDGVLNTENYPVRFQKNPPFVGFPFGIL